VPTPAWITRSSTVGTPSGRCDPSGLGMNTRRTGAGRYVPSISAEHIRGQCSRLKSGNASMLIPSIPGAPALVLTRGQALDRFSGSSICSIMVFILRMPPCFPLCRHLPPLSAIRPVDSILHTVGTSLSSSALPAIKSSGLFVYTGDPSPPARCSVLWPLLTPRSGCPVRGLPR